MRIDRVPYTAVQAYLKDNDTVLIPLGSCEQQGPHLPMGAETFIVEGVADAVGERTGFAVTPAMPINYAHLFLDFPGVLTADLEHYYRFLEDVCHGLAHQGFRHFFFVNIHFGSAPAMEAIARTVRAKYPDAVTGACECFQLMREASDTPVATDFFPFGHASERTTSMCLHLCPELVDMGKVQVGKPGRFDSGLEVMANAKARYGKSSIALYMDCADYNPMGCYGDPSGATAEKGQAIFGDVVDYVTDVVTAFSKTTFVDKG
jgi:creatinine amidohydrolase